MARIRVLQAFTLNLGATQQKFAPGTVDVTDEVADHWYTQRFAERVEPPVVVGAPAADPPEHATDLSGSQTSAAGDSQGAPAASSQPGQSSAGDGDAVDHSDGDAGSQRGDDAAASGESITVEDDGSTHVDTAEEIDEKVALKAEAEALGVQIDGRWGVARIRAAIDAAKA